MTRAWMAVVAIGCLSTGGIIFYLSRRLLHVTDELVRAAAEREALLQALGMLGHPATLDWETEDTLRVRVHYPPLLGAKPLSRESLN